MKLIDIFLNRITMYKLVLYSLIAWVMIAMFSSSFGVFSFTPYALLYSVAVLLVVSLLTQIIFTKVFHVQDNVESTKITALILALIISPPLAGQYVVVLPILIWAGIWSVAVKYILALGKKHIFNPAGFAVVLTAVTIGQSASWWVGTAFMLPFVLIGGLLIVRKIKRFDLVISFLVVALGAIVMSAFNSVNTLTLLGQIFLHSPLVFFAFVMLTEPTTTPPTRVGRIAYGAITGLLYAPFIHIGSIISTPELTLCVGNIFSWLVSPKSKYVLTLKSKAKIARDTGEFVFTSDRKIHYKPGQYLEWTLDHRFPDSRGNRRFFTIASSPTEKDILLGVKFDIKKSSSFKTALAELDEGKEIVVGQLAGDFTLPKDKNKKLCFIAGGIGITPFRSMIAYMIDKNEKRDVVLVYSCKRMEELAYTNLIHHAHMHVGMKTVSTLTDVELVPKDWTGYKGFINVELLLQEIPDYMERVFYISGPPALVSATEKILAEIGVDNKNVKTDYFPGF